MGSLASAYYLAHLLVRHADGQSDPSEAPPFLVGSPDCFVEFASSPEVLRQSLAENLVAFLVGPLHWTLSSWPPNEATMSRGR